MGKQKTSRGEMEQTEKPKRPINSDDLYALIKVIREYRHLLPKTDEDVMERYKMNVSVDLLNKVLANGVEWVIDHYTDKRNALIVKEQARQELDKEV